ETARLLCKYRPSTPIIACVLSEQVYRHLAISWGIIPLMMGYAHDTDELLDLSIATAQKAKLVADGDLVVITAGLPVGVSGTTNMIKAHLVGDALISGVGVGFDNAMGLTCVCHNAEEVKLKFKPGNVLVVPATTNEMLDALRDATAIIAEEAGLNSHAAIVGLTLAKPVVVGAIGATRKLHDGMKVSVDGERGVVHAMPL
ncbi:MAG: pyruvate kinase alpha/beta domain-containing protein, partial [Ruthenibacterium sp.]